MTMASQIANAIENAIILQRAELLARDKERSVRELSLLYEISRSMHTTIKLEQLLRIILLSITLANRQGFDRAALFLVDEKEKRPQRDDGRGTQKPRRAEKWRRKIEDGRIFSQGRMLPEEMDLILMTPRSKKIRVSLDKQRSILIRTIIEMRSFNIQNAASESAVNSKLLRWLAAGPLLPFR